MNVYGHTFRTIKFSPSEPDDLELWGAATGIQGRLYKFIYGIHDTVLSLTTITPILIELRSSERFNDHRIYLTHK